MMLRIQQPEIVRDTMPANMLDQYTKTSRIT
jgi:hypothetical protein